MATERLKVIGELHKRTAMVSTADRVPRILGEFQLTCPVCHHRLDGRTGQKNVSVVKGYCYGDSVTVTTKRLPK